MRSKRKSSIAWTYPILATTIALYALILILSVVANR